MTENGKQRTRRLIQAGGLVDLAGLGGMDADLLLGVLLQGKEYVDSLKPNQVEILRKKGSERIEERKREKERLETALPKIGADQWRL